MKNAPLEQWQMPPNGLRNSPDWNANRISFLSFSRNRVFDANGLGLYPCHKKMAEPQITRSTLSIVNETHVWRRQRRVIARFLLLTPLTFCSAHFFAISGFTSASRSPLLQTDNDSRTIPLIEGLIQISRILLRHQAGHQRIPSKAQNRSDVYDDAKFPTGNHCWRNEA